MTDRRGLAPLRVPRSFVTSNGYRRLTGLKGHPLADKSGEVFEHRYVVHEAGIDIPPGAVVHHINGDKLDNRLENLRVYKNNSQHMTEEHGGVVTGRELRLLIRLGRSYNDLVPLGIGPTRFRRVKREMGIVTRIVSQSTLGRMVEIERQRRGLPPIHFCSRNHVKPGEGTKCLACARDHDRRRRAAR